MRRGMAMGATGMRCRSDAEMAPRPSHVVSSVSVSPSPIRSLIFLFYFRGETLLPALENGTEGRVNHAALLRALVEASLHLHHLPTCTCYSTLVLTTTEVSAPVAESLSSSESAGLRVRCACDARRRRRLSMTNCDGTPSQLRGPAAHYVHAAAHR